MRTLVLALIILGIGCGSPSDRPPKEIKRDTTLTVAAVLGYKKSGWFPIYAKRIVADSLMWVGDTMNQKRSWGKATYYLVNLPVIVDSAISATYKVPLLDSAGKSYTVTIKDVVYVYPNVRDTLYDLDAIGKHFNSMLKKDSIK